MVHFNSTNNGEAKFNEKWYMMCIDDNKFALFTHVGLTRTYLSFDVNGTVLESRKHIYPDRGDIGTIESVQGASKSCFALESSTKR